MKHNQLIKPSDIVFAAVIAAAGFLLWFFPLFHAPGELVVIRRDGAVVAQLPLAEDTSYEVRGAYTNVFEIKDGAVRVTYTDCPGHQCEKTGAVSAAGAGIVCAPNHVSATVEGKEAAVDAIAG